MITIAIINKINDLNRNYFQYLLNFLLLFYSLEFNVNALLSNLGILNEFISAITLSHYYIGSPEKND